MGAFVVWSGNGGGTIDAKEATESDTSICLALHPSLSASSILVEADWALSECTGGDSVSSLIFEAPSFAKRISSMGSDMGRVALDGCSCAVLSSINRSNSINVLISSGSKD